MLRPGANAVSESPSRKRLAAVAGLFARRPKQSPKRASQKFKRIVSPLGLVFRCSWAAANCPRFAAASCCSSSAPATAPGGAAVEAAPTPRRQSVLWIWSSTLPCRMLHSSAPLDACALASSIAFAAKAAGHLACVSPRGRCFYRQLKGNCFRGPGFERLRDVSSCKVDPAPKFPAAKPTVMGGQQVCNQACRPCNDGGVTVTTQ
jgi:hypothetical protein